MLIFIVNPASAGGRGRETWSRLEAELNKRRTTYKVYMTKRSNQASILTRQAIRAFDARVVVAVGGDGTVHEVIQALVHTSIPLGFIPAGSGNDFARALQIPIKGTDALERILNFQARTMDVARVNDRYVINGMGAGFDGEVARMTNRLRERYPSLRLGKFVYLVNALRLWPRFEPMALNVFLSGERHRFNRVWLIAVLNIPQYGGGMKVCPGAAYDDGYLDVCLVSEQSRGCFLRNLPHVFRGTHVRSPGIQLFRTRQLQIESDQCFPIHTDGENDWCRSATIHIVQHALTVL